MYWSACGTSHPVLMSQPPQASVSWVPTSNPTPTSISRRVAASWSEIRWWLTQRGHRCFLPSSWPPGEFPFNGQQRCLRAAGISASGSMSRVVSKPPRSRVLSSWMYVSQRRRRRERRRAARWLAGRFTLAWSFPGVAMPFSRNVRV